MEASRAATVRAEEEVKLQKGLASTVKKTVTNALSDVASLREHVAVTNMREERLLSRVSSVSFQIERTTVE